MDESKVDAAMERLEDFLGEQKEEMTEEEIDELMMRLFYRFKDAGPRDEW